MAGWRYAEYDMNRSFPIETLVVRWTITESKGDAYRLEGQTLKEYFTTHLELPPLNYKFNWSEDK